MNFWARWAGDSRREMPALNRINTTYERAGLVVLGISIDEDLRRAREFADSMKVSYPLMFDTGSEIGRDYQLGKNAHDDSGRSLGCGALFPPRVQTRRRPHCTSIKYANCFASKARYELQVSSCVDRRGSLVARVRLPRADGGRRPRGAAPPAPPPHQLRRPARAACGRCADEPRSGDDPGTDDCAAGRGRRRAALRDSRRRRLQDAGSRSAGHEEGRHRSQQGPVRARGGTALSRPTRRSRCMSRWTWARFSRSIR